MNATLSDGADRTFNIPKLKYLSSNIKFGECIKTINEDVFDEDIAAQKAKTEEEKGDEDFSDDDEEERESSNDNQRDFFLTHH